MAMMQVVRVKRETIVECMTCSICNKLFRDATTISECLHTFCRKCIYKKISDEELECCPICNIHLGCVPLEKLRPDHSLQDVRAKIFPFKRRRVEEPEAVPSVTLPARRKERSLSSLVVSTPKVSTQIGKTGRRTKGVARKALALRNSRFSNEKPVKIEDDSAEDRPESSNSHETLNRVAPNIRQSSSTAERRKPIPTKEIENGAESWEGKLDLWKPLNYLVEVANRTKVEPAHVADAQTHLYKAKNKEHWSTPTVEDEKIQHASSEIEDTKKLRRLQRKRNAALVAYGISPQAILDTASDKHEKRVRPIWFSLVASEDQGGDASLPQIPASYLRIRDGDVPISFVQKYLMRKLHLTSETEVELKCMGQPVVPTLKLYDLVDLWLQSTSTSQRVPASIGSSAKDFVMVLAYARKAPNH